MKRKSDSPLTIRTMFEVVYCESIPNNDIEELIRLLNPLEYSYILHDKDIDINGELKKPHYHIWCCWETPQRHDSILKMIGLNERHRITTARSKKSCHLYMVHRTKEAKRMNKILYDDNDIFSNLDSDTLNDLLLNNDKVVGSELSQIFDLIRSYSCTDENELLYLELAERGLLDTYNRYYHSVFKRFV